MLWFFVPGEVCLAAMEATDKLRELEQRRQQYLSILHDSGRKSLEREVAQRELQQVETKITELHKSMSTEDDEPLFDIGGEA